MDNIYVKQSSHTRATHLKRNFGTLFHRFAFQPTYKHNSQIFSLMIKRVVVAAFFQKGMLTHSSQSGYKMFNVD